ncbi:unnamed protein product [Schistocephalus solidus]|uniref:C2H2-type domain-containing protein n=1 Tax=Schistocephalus solidus TaxID=70667 RepID=A0A183TRP0_SCHSO|nr:unnamed protein product [Schistocephalus solidus]
MSLQGLADREDKNDFKQSLKQLQRNLPTLEDLVHRTEAGELVPGAPKYTHHVHLNSPHCPHTFNHRMGILGHMRIHENLQQNITGLYRIIASLHHV